MKRIPLEHISLAYDLSKEIYSKNLTRQEAIDRVKESNMNVGSANIYFQIYQHLIDGQTFTRTISAESFDYFLERILFDFGTEKLGTALNALKSHIEYFENVQGVQMGKVNNIYTKYLKIISNQTLIEIIVDEDDESSFPEGKDLYRLHKSKERNKALIKLAKERHFKNDNKLCCQVCSFSFIETYGEIGTGFIEAHHIFPISQLTEETQTKVEDIALVCSNCHRMLHRQRPWISIKNLKLMRQ